MIVVTGALGFIGSCLVRGLNDAGIRDVLVADDFYQDFKEPNLHGKWIREWIHRDIFLQWLRRSHQNVEFIFHLGARTDTASTDEEVFERLNLQYSKAIWKVCSENEIPLIYASSASTYGNGEHGFSDESDISPYQPLNAYARSKQAFDVWALEQRDAPPKWAGLKFFNVYGPNEYHKDRMASVVFHAFNQIQRSGSMKLFRSHKDGIADGEQKRDFIYVKDLIDVCLFLKEHDFENGLYNLGSGEARTFLDLVSSTFKAMGREEKIDFIDTPLDIRDNYQYFTEATMQKLRSQGYDKAFTPLEEGIDEYVRLYLTGKNRY